MESLQRLIEGANIRIVDPLGYLDFLRLLSDAAVVLTDSGGIQEEATAPGIRKSVLVIRLSTERPEAVEAGFAKVVGTEKSGILSAVEAELAGPVDLPKESPFGDGRAAEKIVDVVQGAFFSG